MPYFRWISIAVLGLLGAPILLMSVESVDIHNGEHCLVHGIDGAFNRVLVDGQTWTEVRDDSASGRCRINAVHITTLAVDVGHEYELPFTRHNNGHISIDNSRWIDIISPSIGLLGGFLKPLLYAYGVLALATFFALAKDSRLPFR